MGCTTCGHMLVHYIWTVYLCVDGYEFIRHLVLLWSGSSACLLAVNRGSGAHSIWSVRC